MLTILSFNELASLRSLLIAADIVNIFSAVLFDRLGRKHGSIAVAAIKQPGKWIDEIHKTSDMKQNVTETVNCFTSDFPAQCSAKRFQLLVLPLPA